MEGVCAPAFSPHAHIWVRYEHLCVLYECCEWRTHVLGVSLSASPPCSGSFSAGGRCGVGGVGGMYRMNEGGGEALMKYEGKAETERVCVEGEGDRRTELCGRQWQRRTKIERKGAWSVMKREN